MAPKINKIILITGCSSGFGNLTAGLLASKGYTVYAGMHHENEIKILDSVANIIPVHLDVTWEQEKINLVIGKIVQKEGRIDVLINNAGFALLGPVSSLTNSELKDQFETNFFAVLRVTHAVLPQMKKQNSGLVIMVNSISGLIATSFYGAYSASKFALEAATAALRFEEAGFGINFVSVNPGSHRTNFWKNIKWAKETPLINEKIQKVVAKISWHRHNPENVAKKILQIIKTSNPRKNYLIGLNAKSLQIAFKLVPYPLIDILGKKFTRKIILP